VLNSIHTFVHLWSFRGLINLYPTFLFYSCWSYIFFLVSLCHEILIRKFCALSKKLKIRNIRFDHLIVFWRNSHIEECSSCIGTQCLLSVLIVLWLSLDRMMEISKVGCFIFHHLLDNGFFLVENASNNI
jgi:hypothetical protein